MTATPAQRAAAKKWATTAVATVAVTQLASILKGALADGYLLGAKATVDHLADAGVETATDAPEASVAVLWRTISNMDWANWKPGSEATADLVKGGGLAKLLEQADITIQGVTDTTLTRIGDRLADALTAGDNVDTLAGDLSDLLDSDGQASAVAVTEMARAMTAGTFDTFADAGVKQWDLVAEDAAEQDCLDIQDANPHDVDDDGDRPPIHPFCRCAALAHLPDASQTSDEGDADGE